MSSHHDSHPQEQKPVSFTVPLIMASVLLFIIIMFLSLCDPKPHHQCEEDCKKECSKECGEHKESTEAATKESQNTETSKAEVKDSTASETKAIKEEAHH
jgi:hypothetical protein